MSENDKKIKFVDENIPAYIVTDEDININAELNIIDILSFEENDLKKYEITKEQYKKSFEKIRSISESYGTLLKVYNIYLSENKKIITTGNFEFVHEKIDRLKNYSDFKFIKVKNIFTNLEVEKVIVAANDAKEIKVDLLELGFYLIIGNNDSNKDNVDSILLKQKSGTLTTSTFNKKNSNSKDKNSIKNTGKKNQSVHSKATFPMNFNKHIQNINKSTNTITSQSNIMIGGNSRNNTTAMTNARNKGFQNKKSVDNSANNSINKNNFLQNNQVKVSDSRDNNIQKANDVKVKVNELANKKEKAKQKRKESKIKKFNIKINPTLLAFVIILVVIIGIYYFYLISLLFLGSVDGESQLTGYYYVDPTYDFSRTTVDVTNDYKNESDRKIYEAISINDFLMGAAYVEFYDLLGTGVNDQQLMNMYNAYMVITKARALSLGNYNHETKEIFIKSGDSEIPYCDVYNGCKKIDNNGEISYVSNLYADSEPGNVIRSYPPASSTVLNALTLSNNKTQYELLTPNSLKQQFTNYEKFTIPAYNSTIKQTIISGALNNSEYKTIISGISNYSGYKVYDLKEYAWIYSLAANSEWWWPIGSNEPTSDGFYSGPPSTTHVSSKFGFRTLSNGKSGDHRGIDIPGFGRTIIAIRSGTVMTALNTCKDNKGTNDSLGQCGMGNGNFVRLDHGDGYYSVYCHLKEGSVVVKEGDFVMQGQLLALMGNSGYVLGGGHLHFGIAYGEWSDYVDPLEYVDPENPRPYSEGKPFLKGKENKESLCLSLKSNGFNDEATAAVLLNIDKTSGYNPNAKSVNNALYGLFGYNSGQVLKLKAACGSEYNDIKCQFEYFMNDLTNNYLEVKNILLSSSSYNDKIFNLCYNYLTLANKHNECSARSNIDTETILNYVKNGCK